MKLSDFDYFLPPELIAQEPAEKRDQSRLLVVPPEGPLDHRQFADLPDYLKPSDLLVLNDTRVLRARLILRRATGGKVEALLVRAVGERRWEALLDTPRRLKEGDRLQLEDSGSCAIEGRTPEGKWILAFDGDVEELIRRRGRAPLPPYIRRAAREEDLERYQTVYARKDGAIAAPTAGLHFTSELLAALARTLEIARITLHVGMGTFKPVHVDDLSAHRMEPEAYEIPPETERAVRRAREEGRRVVAVGTTTCRTLESWARTGLARGTTDLFIRPPFDFRAVGALVTNFHVPKSTLLMLVSAFAGRERILEAYAEAVRLRYRFFSYGDATLLLR